MVSMLYALRVFPAETRLTVYRRRQVFQLVRSRTQDRVLTEKCAHKEVGRNSARNMTGRKDYRIRGSILHEKCCPYMVVRCLGKF